MRGYLILEIDLDEDATPAFQDTFDAAKTALDEATIERVSRVHIALGADGLHESVAYLLSDAD